MVNWQRWRLLWLGLLTVAVAGTGLGLGYLLQSGRLARQQPPVRATPEPVQAAGGQQADWPAGVTVVTPTTEIIVRTTYLKTDETIDVTEKPEESIVGLSLEGLRRFHPEWTVIDFSPERLVVRAIKDAWPPGVDPTEMERYRTIGIQDGRVSVFWGKAGPGERLKEVTPFAAADLTPEARAMLEKGYTVEGDEAVAQYLEGLAE
ncbi:MAG: hypothetical protein ACYC5Y_11800 [Symbiobacteriia bacterium]